MRYRNRGGRAGERKRETDNPEFYFTRIKILGSIYSYDNYVLLHADKLQ